MSKQTLGTAIIALGAIVVTIGSQMSLGASLTEQGGTLGTEQVGEIMWIDQQVVLPAAIESSNGTGVLAFGMLMMLLGFGLHALWTIRKNDEVSVPVKVRKQQTPKKTARKSRKQMEVIWIERTIRL